MNQRRLLYLDNVTAAYGARSVLHAITIALHEGEILALMGPSAVGKTTLLHIAAGLISATTGQVERDGYAALAFQVPSLLPWLSVSDNALFGASLTGRLEKARLRLPSLLERYSLTQYRAALPHELSIGTQQRVAFIRALLADSRVLLLDEPFAACDVVLRRRLQQDLRLLVTRDALGALMVTHDFIEAVRVADHVVVLGGGPPGSVLADIHIDVTEDARFAGDVSVFASHIAHLDSVFAGTHEGKE